MIDAVTPPQHRAPTGPGPALREQTDPPAPTAPDQPQPPTHDAQALTDGGTRAWIVLNGQTYSLRITRAGKLILTK